MKQGRTLVSLLLACLALGGCGAVDYGAQIASAAEAMAETDTLRFAVAVETEMTDAVMTATFDGALDVQTEALRMVMEVAVDEASDGAATVEPEPPLELIVDDEHVYMAMPELASITEAEWLRTTVQEMGFEGGFPLAGLREGSAGFTGVLANPGEYAEKIEKVGREEVRAGPATRYRFVIEDFAEALEALQAAGGEDAGALVEEYWDTFGADSLEFDAWLDDEGRLVRMRYVAEGGVDGGPLGADATQTTTFDFYDYGADIDVAPPGPDDYIDAAELQSLIGIADW